MSAATTGEVPVRAGANRAFGYAVLASILLHALLLAALPSSNELSALLPAEPPPLNARVVRAEPPALAARELRESPPRPPAEPRRPSAKPPPAAGAATAVPEAAPQPAPVAVSEPVPAAPASAIAPAAPVPLASIDMRALARPAPAPQGGALERFRADLNIAAARFKRYPRAAIDNNWEGEVVVLMSIDAGGRIDALRVKRSSGYDILDRQALDMFRTARPYVQIPPELRGRQFEVELRAIYGLQDQDSG